jgi:uncharacterized caspase-like protein
MKVFWAIGAAVLGIVTAAPAVAESRLAFVVGNDAYRNVPSLQKAVNNARAVSRSLQQLGFRVTLGENLAWRDYVEKFSLFESSIRPGDVAFLFYSGHGVEIDGANFLIPVDAPKVSPEQQSLLKDVSISTDNMIQRLKARGTRTQIIVLDACRENPFRLRRRGRTRPAVGQRQRSEFGLHAQLPAVIGEPRKLAGRSRQANPQQGEVAGKHGRPDTIARLL